MSDRGSVRSNGRYRRVGRDSNVDESLFGNTGHDKLRKGGAEAIATPVFISEHHLNAMKARSIMQNQSMKLKKKEMDAEKREQYERAQKRKEKMYELEQQRLASRGMTAEEQEDALKAKASLSRAEDSRMENHDCVKMMRRKMMYAQCAKIRDSQLEEKQLAREKLKVEDEHQDILMEVERLKKIEMERRQREAQERRRKKDANQVREQIREREHRKIIEEELLEQEKEQSKRMMDLYDRKEQAKKAQQRVEAKQLLQHVLKANEEAIQKRYDRIQEEKDEDERIAQWQREKVAAEEAAEAERLRIKAQKDKEFHEVASQMKKAQDNRSSEDALRAKRYQQEQERKYRQKERDEKLKRQQQLEELAKAREEQSRGKIEHLKRLALEDQALWEKINAENAAATRAMDESAARKALADKQYEKEIRAQKDQKEAVKRLQKLEKFETVRRENAENAELMHALQLKKEQILREMEEEGIPEKFRVEVAQMKLSL